MLEVPDSIPSDTAPDPSGGRPPGSPRRRRVLLIAGAMAALLVLLVASIGILPPPAQLTPEQFAYCDGHFWDGMDAATVYRDDPSEWYFFHMGSRTDPETIRVCQAAWARR